MRNRRLLTLAVLAVAIGFAASAQATTPPPADTAIVTVITTDPTGGTGNFTINVRLWDGGGVGVDSSSAGLMDFAVTSIKGATGTTVTGVTNDAPRGYVTSDGDPGSTPKYRAGFFSILPDLFGAGYKEAVQNPASSGIWNISGLQPALYPVKYDSVGQTIVFDTVPGADTLRDAAVIIGVGTVGRAKGSVLDIANGKVITGLETQNGVGQLTADPGDFAADTQIASGTYSQTTPGPVEAFTFGPISFSTLPVPGTAPFKDSMNNFIATGAVVVQTITGPSAASNNGGKSVLAGGNPALAQVNMRVEEGNITLGSGFAGGANVTLQLSNNRQDPPGTPVAVNTKVTLTADHILGGTVIPGTPPVLAGLDIRLADPGQQVVDIGTARLDIYPVGLSTVLESVQYMALVIGGDIGAGGESTGMRGNATDGLYSSAIDPGNPNHTLVVTPEAGDHVAIKATLYGDADLSGTVDTGDYGLLGGSWGQSDKYWSDGDFDGSGTVDTGDYGLMGGNWGQTFVPYIPPAPPVGGLAVPEPATLSLLVLGAMGILRRRRK